MSVQIDPTELGFRRPFTHEVTQLLRLQNPSFDPMAFKVKTTAPKQYCVRPNSGRIEPGSEVEVQVLLQAMPQDPPSEFKCRDKFLVQSVEITPDKDTPNIANIWQNVEKTGKGSIQERKIRVVFLPATDATSTPVHNNVNGMRHSDDAPPAYSSPSPDFGSPATEAATPVGRGAEADHLRSANDVKGGLSNTASAAQSSIGAAASSVANAVPTSGEDVRAQLNEAKATISKLTAQLQEQGLRQRKTDAVNQDSRERITTGTTGMGIQQQPGDGVPVQIVAALCLLSFLLAYFFF